METYLKCLLKCKLPLRICDAHLKPVLLLGNVCKPLSTLYARFFVHCVTAIEAEQKLMYSQARLFIAYDGALEGGRDQDWWFKQCADRMAETVQYWAGTVPSRVSYCMAMDSPMEYPHAYVKWRTYEAYYRAKAFTLTNKYWMLAAPILYFL